MKHLFMLQAILLLACVTLQAQASQPDSLGFPASWSGNWVGQLNIFNGKGKVQSVEMTVEVAKLDTSTAGRYAFGLVYGSKAADYRPYELVPVAPENGIWKVDEKNNIAMESYYYGGKLICWFVVQGSRVLCTYEKISDTEMVFEVVSGTEKAVSVTGKGTHAGEEIPEVTTFPVAVFQRAHLKKQQL